MGRDRNPRALKNWSFTCACGYVYPHPKKMTDVGAHEAKKHDGEKQKLHMRWVGVGPAPYKIEKR